jgi:hypothetical protein
MHLLMRKKGWIGLGVIARDREGFCLGACSISKQEQVDPKMAETMAALQAIIFSKEAGVMEVIFGEGNNDEATLSLKKWPFHREHSPRNG